MKIWNLVEVEEPARFKGKKRFNCLVRVGSMNPQIIEKDCFLNFTKNGEGELRTLIGDWQEVIAWREITE